MRDNVFLDTNIFVYLYSEDEPEKQSIAIEILEKLHGIISTQVINEFCSACLKKLKIPNLIVQLAVEEIIESCELCFIDEKVIKKALKLNAIYGYSYYDSLILASAILNDCKYLYSEDMQHNQLIEGKMRIINPFVDNKKN
jgi:predicted nucleic acid-binding protein